mmetsp:Transcript_13772/g.30903  ORF Transcript_13772/g.30903 Transcript_13772/m.30903 type:complete len:200 (+) Transcript_13772:171-770(+)
MNAEGVSLAAKALQHFNVLQGADASDASVASAVDISGQQLLRLAREGLQRARDRREPVDLEFLLVLLCDQGVEAEAEAEAGDAGASEGGEGGMRGTDSPASSDDIFSQLLSLAPLCAVSGQSLCRLFDALRLGAMGWGVSDSVSGSGGSGSGSGTANTPSSSSSNSDIDTDDGHQDKKRKQDHGAAPSSVPAFLDNPIT